MKKILVHITGAVSEALGLMIFGTPSLIDPLTVCLKAMITTFKLKS